MHTISLRARGAGLIVLLAGIDNAAPTTVPFIPWAEKLIADAGHVGVKLEVQQAQGQPGNFFVGNTRESFTAATPEARTRGFLCVIDALVAGGVPRDTEGGQSILNFITAGAAREGGQGRASRVGFYVNLSNLEAGDRRGGNTQVVMPAAPISVEQQVADACEAYMAADLDLDALEAKDSLSNPLKLAWLKAQLTKAGKPLAAATPATEAPTEAPI